MLEVASELVAMVGFGSPQAAVTLRPQGARGSELELFGSDGPLELERVATGEIFMAIINPSALLTVAVRGVPPFRGPLPLRAIAVIPSYDQLVLAARYDGIKYVEELVDVHAPLRIALRGQRSHSIHIAIDHVLQACGLSLADFRAWGGSVSFVDGLPVAGGRLDAVRNDQVDAIFEEAARTWTEQAVKAGMTVLSLREETTARLETWGYRRSVLEKRRCPTLPYDVPTIDFSGFPIYVREDADADLVASVCEALEARQDRIQLDDGQPIPLREMCAGSTAAPLDVPFHDAARRYWEKAGYI